jgi:hypothetical protein
VESVQGQGSRSQGTQGTGTSVQTTQDTCVQRETVGHDHWELDDED